MQGTRRPSHDSIRGGSGAHQLPVPQGLSAFPGRRKSQGIPRNVTGPRPLPCSPCHTRIQEFFSSFSNLKSGYRLIPFGQRLQWRSPVEPHTSPHPARPPRPLAPRPPCRTRRHRGPGPGTHRLWGWHRQERRRAEGREDRQDLGEPPGRQRQGRRAGEDHPRRRQAVGRLGQRRQGRKAVGQDIRRRQDLDLGARDVPRHSVQGAGEGRPEPHAPSSPSAPRRPRRSTSSTCARARAPRWASPSRSRSSSTTR